MKPTITIPNVQPTLGPVIKNTEPMIEAMRGHLISSASEADEVAALIGHAKKTLQDLEKQEKTITQPLHEAKKAVHDLFRLPKSLLSEFIDLGKACLIKYQEKQEAEREKLVEAASVAFVAGNVTEGREASIAAVQVQTAAPQGISFTDFWDFEIVSEDQIERALCSPDLKKIRSKLSFVSLSDNPPNLPGLRVFKNKRATNNR